jgi:predicted RNase H-like HicB family nuclease
MKYRVTLEQSDEGLSVSVPGLPGCHSQGKTEKEALENIADAIRDYLAVATALAGNGNSREIEIR